MKKLILATLLTVVLGMAGCIPSLHPIYTDEDVVFEPALLGIWSNNEEGGELYRFTRQGRNAYRLVFTEKDGDTQHFVCHMTNLGGHLFLDIFPDQRDKPENGSFVPVHWIMRIQKIEPRLKWGLLDLDGLKKILEKNPKALKHEKVDDGILLTASTEELRAFLAGNGDSEDLFGDTRELIRWLPVR